MFFSRKAEKIYKITLLLADFLAINLAFSLAWFIRFKSGIIPLKQFQPYEVYIISVSLASIFWLLVFAYKGLYEPEIKVDQKQVAEKLIPSIFIAALITMALSFLYRSFSYSRLVFIAGTCIAYGILLSVRFIFNRVSRLLLEKGIGTAKTLIIGDNNLSRRLEEEIKSDPCLKEGFLGILAQTDETELRRVLIDKNPDRVILTDTSLDEEKILELIYECRKEKATFELLPPFYNLLQGRIELSKLGEFNLVAIRDIALKEWQRLVKRTMDIVLSVAIIILLLPLFILVALLIKLTSPGPVFYKQLRVGRNGRRFYMYKFRSMYKDADKRVDELLKQYKVESLALIKFKHDPRVTSIGRFLRKYSIDEFPQLINVLKGEMSLVGPRPPLEREVELYEKWQLKRIDVLPGMTGLWQISGRSDTTFEDMVKLDIEYIKNWSIWLDIKILIKTPFVVISGKGAY